MTNGEWFMATTTQPLEVKRNGTCIWLYFNNEENHYMLPTEWWDAEQTKLSNRITKEQATPIRDYMVQQTEPQTDCFFRNPTAEEMKSVRDYIDSISVPTGVNVFDLMDELQMERKNNE